MLSQQKNDQENQTSPEDQKQLWRMRWFFILFLASWGFLWIFATVVIFYIAATIVPMTSNTLSLIPLISGVSGIGLTSAFWTLLQRLTKYLFPMGKQDFELAKEKSRIARQKKNAKEIYNKNIVREKVAKRHAGDLDEGNLLERLDNRMSDKK